LGALKERAQVLRKRGGSTQGKEVLVGGWIGGWFLRSFASFVEESNERGLSRDLGWG